MIETRQLTKVFVGKKKQRITAVDRISFTCQPGLIFGLLGPNGAGKTTTLRMLATILKPTEGTALLDGVDVVKNPGEVRRRIGFLSGDTGLYGRLTPREMVSYYARLYELPPEKIEQRTAQIFDQLEMNEFSDRRNDKLSAGMKQKVSVARTIVHEPPLLILDEPTASLDVLTRRSIVGMMKEYRDRGRTVVFSTHDLHEAENLCDEIAIIHNGKVWAQGTMAELKQNTGKEDLEQAFLALVGEEPDDTGSVEPGASREQN